MRSSSRASASSGRHPRHRLYPAAHRRLHGPQRRGDSGQANSANPSPAPGVHILDPFIGTGNFITRIMQEIKRSALPHKYAQELHCNEIMLLPYYIASMNIEHAYMEPVGEYSPFEGICLVDTFE